MKTKANKRELMKKIKHGLAFRDSAKDVVIADARRAITSWFEGVKGDVFDRGHMEPYPITNVWQDVFCQVSRANQIPCIGKWEFHCWKKKYGKGERTYSGNYGGCRSAGHDVGVQWCAHNRIRMYP